MKKSINIEVPEGFDVKITKNDNDNIVIEFIPSKEMNKESEMKNFIKPFLTNLMITHNERYPNCIIYEQNSEVLFVYNSRNGLFWVEYHKIWTVFYNKFGLNYNETEEFIKTQVEDALKLKGITPFNNCRICSGWVEDALKLKNVKGFA